MLALQNEVAQVVARANLSVVTVICEKPRNAISEDEQENLSADPSDPSAPVGAIGTGWIFRADGMILTNYHVVEGATSVHVSFNSDQADATEVRRFIGFPARVVGYDAASDMAILKINRSNLPILQLADSDATPIGAWTIAIGAPLVELQSVTVGVLSGRDIDMNIVYPSTDKSASRNFYYEYLQTDAALNYGNSGGPLLDLQGRVVGLNTAVEESEQNIGFSLPSNLIRILLPRLLTGKRVKRASLGIAYTRLSPDAAREFGLRGEVLVSSFSPKSGADSAPAQRAGVQSNDIILGVNGKNMPTLEALLASLVQRAPGDTITLNIARPDFAGNGNVKKLAIPVVLGDSALLWDATPPAFSLAPAVPIVGDGLSVVDAQSLNAAQKSRFKLQGTERGAVIIDVALLSRADEARLQKGWRIVRVRQGLKWTEIASAASWKAFEANAAPNTRLLLQLRAGSDASEFRVLILPAK